MSELEDIQRIQEAQLFAERRADAHDSVLRELGQRLLELVRRFERLEDRFEQVLNRSAPDEQSLPDEKPPPHSARLPGGR